MSDEPAMQHSKESQEREIRLAISQNIMTVIAEQSLEYNIDTILADCEKLEAWVLKNEPKDVAAPEALEDTGELSDGYHTFNELYAARHILFVNLCLTLPNVAFWTHRNKEGKTMEGWFILGLQSSDEQLTFHLPVEYLPYVAGEIKEVERNELYDGHGTDEVLERLSALANITRMTFSDHESCGYATCDK